MDPLTIKVLASLIQLHGADPTVTSDNKGIDELLGTVRSQLQGNDEASVKLAAYPKAGYPKSHLETLYNKTYTRTYQRWQSGPPVTQPSGPTRPGGRK